MDATSRKYGWIWEKYRPAILNLMIASSNGPQEYKLSKHEFIDSNNKRLTGYTFTLTVFEGKFDGLAKSNAVGLDLKHMLKNSAKAEDLSSEVKFEFKMDKNFVLSIARIPIPAEG